MPTSQLETRAHNALPDIFQTLNGTNFDMGMFDRFRDSGNMVGSAPWGRGAGPQKESHEKQTFPRIILRDALGHELDTFTTLQEAIYRAKWNVKQSGQAKEPLEWRLPKAPLPARPDLTRTFPPVKHPPVVHPDGRVKTNWDHSRVLEFDVEDVGFVRESLQYLPFAPSLSFLRQEILVGPKTYFQIVGTMLLHNRILSQTEKRQAIYNFPGFCSGCIRMGICYGCERSSEVHFHEDKPVKTGGGFTYFKKDRPAREIQSKNPINWKVRHPNKTLKKLMEDYGGVNLEGEIPQEIKRHLDEHGGHRERVVTMDYNDVDKSGNSRKRKVDLHVSYNMNGNNDVNGDDLVDSQGHRDGGDLVESQGHRGGGDLDINDVRVDMDYDGGDSDLNSDDPNYVGERANHMEGYKKGGVTRRSRKSRSTGRSKSEADMESSRQRHGSLASTKSRDRSSDHHADRMYDNTTSDEESLDRGNLSDGDGSSPNRSRRRKDKLYKAPPAFKLRKSPKRSISSRSPFSTNRSYDLPKGRGLDIKKSDKGPTQFKDFRKVDAGWKEPKKFELKKVEQKTTKFWSGPAKKSDDSRHTGRRTDGDTSRGMRRVPSPRSISPDSGLESELLTALQKTQVKVKPRVETESPLEIVFNDKGQDPGCHGNTSPLSDKVTNRKAGKPTSQSEKVGKPTIKSETAGNPTSQSEKVGKSTIQSEKAGKPTSQSEKAGKPTSQSEKGGKPTSQSETAGNPTSQSENVGKSTIQSEKVGKPTSQSEKAEKPTIQSEIAGKPAIQSEKAGKPTSQSEKAGKLTIQSEKAGQPTIKSEKVGKPTSQSEKARKPTSQSEKAGKPTIQSKKSKEAGKPTIQSEKAGKPTSQSDPYTSEVMGLSKNRNKNLTNQMVLGPISQSKHLTVSDESCDSGSEQLLNRLARTSRRSMSQSKPSESDFSSESSESGSEQLSNIMSLDGINQFNPFESEFNDSYENESFTLNIRKVRSQSDDIDSSDDGRKKVRKTITQRPTSQSNNIELEARKHSSQSNCFEIEVGKYSIQSNESEVIAGKHSSQSNDSIVEVSEPFNNGSKDISDRKAGFFSRQSSSSDMTINISSSSGSKNLCNKKSRKRSIGDFETEVKESSEIRSQSDGRNSKSSNQTSLDDFTDTATEYYKDFDIEDFQRRNSFHDNLEKNEDELRPLSDEKGGQSKNRYRRRRTAAERNNRYIMYQPRNSCISPILYKGDNRQYRHEPTDDDDLGEDVEIMEMFKDHHDNDRNRLTPHDHHGDYRTGENREPPYNDGRRVRRRETADGITRGENRHRVTRHHETPYEEGGSITDRRHENRDRIIGGENRQRVTQHHERDRENEDRITHHVDHDGVDEHEDEEYAENITTNEENVSHNPSRKQKKQDDRTNSYSKNQDHEKDYNSNQSKNRDLENVSDTHSYRRSNDRYVSMNRDNFPKEIKHQDGAELDNENIGIETQTGNKHRYDKDIARSNKIYNKKVENTSGSLNQENGEKKWIHEHGTGHNNDNIGIEVKIRNKKQPGSDEDNIAWYGKGEDTSRGLNEAENVLRKQNYPVGAMKDTFVDANTEHPGTDNTEDYLERDKDLVNENRNQENNENVNDEEEARGLVANDPNKEDLHGYKHPSVRKNIDIEQDTSDITKFNELHNLSQNKKQDEKQNLLNNGNYGDRKQSTVSKKLFVNHFPGNKTHIIDSVPQYTHLVTEELKSMSKAQADRSKQESSTTTTTTSYKDKVDRGGRSQSNVGLGKELNIQPTFDQMQKKMGREGRIVDRERTPPSFMSSDGDDLGRFMQEGYIGASFRNRSKSVQIASRWYKKPPIHTVSPVLFDKAKQYKLVDRVTHSQASKRSGSRPITPDTFNDLPDERNQDIRPKSMIRRYQLMHDGLHCRRADSLPTENVEEFKQNLAIQRSKSLGKNDICWPTLNQVIDYNKHANKNVKFSKVTQQQNNPPASDDGMNSYLDPSVLSKNRKISLKVPTNKRQNYLSNSQSRLTGSFIDEEELLDSDRNRKPKTHVTDSFYDEEQLLVSDRNRKPKTHVIDITHAGSCPLPFSPPLIPSDMEKGSLTSFEPDLELVFDDVIDVENLEIEEVDLTMETMEDDLQNKEERKRRHKHRKHRRRKKDDKRTNREKSGDLDNDTDKQKADNLEEQIDQSDIDGEEEKARELDSRDKKKKHGRRAHKSHAETEYQSLYNEDTRIDSQDDVIRDIDRPLYTREKKRRHARRPHKSHTDVNEEDKSFHDDDYTRNYSEEDEIKDHAMEKKKHRKRADPNHNVEDQSLHDGNVSIGSEDDDTELNPHNDTKRKRKHRRRKHGRRQGDEEELSSILTDSINTVSLINDCKYSENVPLDMKQQADDDVAKDDIAKGNSSSEDEVGKLQKDGRRKKKKKVPGEVLGLKRTDSSNEFVAGVVSQKGKKKPKKKKATPKTEDDEVYMEKLPSIKSQLAKLFGDEYGKVLKPDKDDNDDIDENTEKTEDYKVNNLDSDADIVDDDGNEFTDTETLADDDSGLRDIHYKPKSADRDNWLGLSGMDVKKYRSMSLPLLTDLHRIPGYAGDVSIEDLKRPLRVPIYLPGFSRGKVICKKQFKSNPKRVKGRGRSFSVSMINLTPSFFEDTGTNKSELEPVREETLTPDMGLSERANTPLQLRVVTPTPDTNNQSQDRNETQQPIRLLNTEFKFPLTPSVQKGRVKRFMFEDFSLNTNKHSGFANNITNIGSNNILPNKQCLNKESRKKDLQPKNGPLMNEREQTNKVKQTNKGQTSEGQQINKGQMDIGQQINEGQLIKKGQTTEGQHEGQSNEGQMNEGQTNEGQQTTEGQQMKLGRPPTPAVEFFRISSHSTYPVSSSLYELHGNVESTAEKPLSPVPPAPPRVEPPKQKREIIKKEKKLKLPPELKPRTPTPIEPEPTPSPPPIEEERVESREISFVREPSLPRLPPIEVPDLPEFQEVHTEVKSSKKERKLIEVTPDLPEQKKKLPPPPKLGPKIKTRQPSKRRKVAEAPVTSQELQQLSDPLDFLAKYCIINPDRLPFYERIFNGATNVQTPRYSRDQETGGIVHLPPAQLSEHELNMLKDMTVITHAQSPRREGISVPEQYLEKLNYSIEFIKTKQGTLHDHMHKLQAEKIRLMAQLAKEMDRDIVRVDYRTKGKKKKKEDEDSSPKKKKKKKGGEPDYDMMGAMATSLKNFQPTKTSDITDEVIVSRMDDKMLKKAKKDPIVKQFSIEISRDVEKLKNFDQRISQIEDEKDLVGLYCMDHYFAEQNDSQPPYAFRRQQSRLYQKLHPDPDVEMNVEEVEMALQQINNKLLSEKEFQYIYFIMDLPKREKINFRLFSIIAALSEKVTQMDPMIRKLINKMDYNALDVKMDKSKELFELLQDEDQAPVGNAPAETLAVELTAGGLTPEHTSYVLSKFNRNGRGFVDFLDFVTYVPLFVDIHKRIIEDPFNDSLDI